MALPALVAALGVMLVGLIEKHIPPVMPLLGLTKIHYLGAGLTRSGTDHAVLVSDDFASAVGVLLLPFKLVTRLIGKMLARPAAAEDGEADVPELTLTEPDTAPTKTKKQAKSTARKKPAKSSSRKRQEPTLMAAAGGASGAAAADAEAATPAGQGRFDFSSDDE